MPYIKPKRTPTIDIMFRVAATAWFNYLRCRVRRCRRDCRCLGRVTRSGMFLCARDMTGEQMDEMLNFFVETADLATPEMVEESLAQAKTQDERELIEFRRWVFLYYQAELARAGLAEPLGPPFGQLKGETGKAITP